MLRRPSLPSNPAFSPASRIRRPGAAGHREAPWRSDVQEQQLGGATLQVVKRTVRCPGINLNGVGADSNASKAESEMEVDIAGLLQRHFRAFGSILGTLRAP